MARKHQKGNALLFVLMGIVLFAALMYTMARSGRTSQNMAVGEANIAAQSVLTFADKVANAVTQVTLAHNCRISKISFDGPTELTGYNNGTSPGNGKCHVFHDRGGSTRYYPPPANALDSSKSGEDGYGQYLFLGNVCVDNIGTGALATCATDTVVNEELLIILPWINFDTCRAINQVLKHPDILDDASTSFNPNLKYTGGFSEGFTIGRAGFTAYKKGCFESSGSPPGAGYHFYAVLAAR